MKERYEGGIWIDLGGEKSKMKNGENGVHTRKIMNVGTNSKAVIIPPELIKEFRLKRGQTVSLFTDGSGIRIEPRIVVVVPRRPFWERLSRR